MHTTVGSTDLPNSMGHGPLGPTSSDSPVSPFEAHLWEETENQQAIILPVNGHHKLLMLYSTTYYVQLSAPRYIVQWQQQSQQRGVGTHCSFNTILGSIE